jgi:hypothetical protein
MGCEGTEEFERGGIMESGYRRFDRGLDGVIGRGRDGKANDRRIGDVGGAEEGRADICFASKIAFQSHRVIE